MQNLKKFSLFVPLKTDETTKPVWLGFNMSQRAERCLALTLI